MKPILIVALLGVMTASAATSHPVIAMQGQPVVNGIPTGGGLGATEIDLVKWAVNQGGLTAVLLAVLWSYRRDFYRKQEARQGEIDVLREEKRMLANVIEKNSDAMTRQALAVQANTDATRALAQNVAILADRRREDRP